MDYPVEPTVSPRRCTFSVQHTALPIKRTLYRLITTNKAVTVSPDKRHDVIVYTFTVWAGWITGVRSQRCRRRKEASVGATHCGRPGPGVRGQARGPAPTWA